MIAAEESKICILLIEDSNADQVLFCEIAKAISPRFSIACVDNGLEAIEYLEDADSDPIAVFLDINMPKMNGHELMQAYGNNFNDRNIPVYVLTSSSYDQDRVLFSPYNIADYCLKSASYDNIRAILAALANTC
ncbi:MAG: response regulator [Pseudomonadota bacterium]